jgi:threonylcarbamoyladenosine tRNA methylthiotransferase MtaB
MPDQHNNATKESRAARAAQVAAELETAYDEAMIGKIYPVLFEQVEHDHFTGHAPNYVKVYAKGDDLGNVVKSVRITGLFRDGVLGEIVH